MLTERVLHKVNEAYDEFRQEMFDKPAAELYEYAYKIYTINEIYEILQNGYEFLPQIAKTILDFKGNILEQLYLEWIECDYSRIDELNILISESLKDLSKVVKSNAA